jgi:hypothetical protein
MHFIWRTEHTMLALCQKLTIWSSTLARQRSQISHGRTGALPQQGVDNSILNSEILTILPSENQRSPASQRLPHFAVLYHPMWWAGDWVNPRLSDGHPPRVRNGRWEQQIGRNQQPGSSSCEVPIRMQVVGHSQSFLDSALDVVSDSPCNRANYY